jgi:flagellar protein FliO/FliZ
LPKISPLSLPQLFFLGSKEPKLTGSFFASSSSFTLAAVAIALLAAVALIAFVFRSLFGRRLKLPKNGRARPARLGIVDAFDLDRKRQLVIVRRDNVEHLVMIGGPNDLVIEAQIARAESREPRGVREAKFRDNELREKEWRELPVPPAEAPLPATSRHKTPSPQAAREELPLELLEGIEQNRERVLPPDARESASLEQGDDGRKSRLAFAAPGRAHEPAFSWSAANGRGRLEPSLGDKAPAAREASPRPAAAPLKRASVSNATARPIGTPLLRTSMRGHGQDASLPAAPRAPESRPEDIANSDLGGGLESCAGPQGADAAAVQAASQAAAGAGTSGSSVASAAAIENRMPDRADTLELEMARLLGREHLIKA